MSSLISLHFSSFLQSKVGEQQQLTRPEARHVSAGEVTNTGFSDVLLRSHRYICTYAGLAKPCWMSMSQSRWVHVWLKSSICDLPLASLGAGPRSLEPVLRDVLNLCGDDTTNVARTRGIFAISIGPKEEEKEEKGICGTKRSFRRYDATAETILNRQLEVLGGLVFDEWHEGAAGARPTCLPLGKLWSKAR